MSAVRRAAEIRSAMRIPRVSVARWAGVSIPIVTLYEAKPEAVGEARRAELDRVYRELGAVLGRLERKAR